MRQEAKSVILVVDDDVDYCETLSVLLSREGYSVECRENGREALDYLSRSIPSLIILDLMMPMMGGWEFLRQRRLDPRLSSVPVLVTTGSGLVDNIDGASVLSKPVDFGVLLGAVRQNCSPQI
jgi:CheY-like chemotaxis protein